MVHPFPHALFIFLFVVLCFILYVNVKHNKEKHLIIPWSLLFVCCLLWHNFQISRVVLKVQNILWDCKCPLHLVGVAASFLPLMEVVEHKNNHATQPVLAVQY